MKKYIALGCLLTAFNLFCANYWSDDDIEFQTMNDFLAKPLSSDDDEFLAQSSDDSDDNLDQFSRLETQAYIPETQPIREKLDKAGLSMPNFNSNNSYIILGIEMNDLVAMNGNTRKDYVTKRYRKLSQIFHPDKNPEDREVNEERFKKISEAYRKIKDSGYALTIF